MSPLSIRRYRAERLLRQQFDALRSHVLRSVRGRLRSSGVRLDEADLEACYAQAWQGLYASLLAGVEIASVRAWLVTVTFRRAIDEHRALTRVGVPTAPGSRTDTRQAALAGRERGCEPGRDPDLAAELDERARLRHLFEGLRGRLGPREREAAVLCYLQGLSRAEAAARMGLSESKMRKLMDGRGAGRPGVAEKVARLVETVREGRWCEEQSSLMRGLAFGILDPDGERYELAVAHRSECPACRAYVLSLRGLSAALPPVLTAPALISTVLGSAGSGALAGVHAGTVGSASVGAAPAQGAGAAGSVLGAGAAGAGAGGGGWVLAGGGLGAKLAVGCVLALGVGAGCAALSQLPVRGRPRTHARVIAPAGPRSNAAASDLRAGAGVATVPGTPIQRSSVTPIAPGAPAESAPREFGLEPALATQAPLRSDHVRAQRASSVSAGALSSSGATAQAPAPAGSGAEPAGARAGSMAQREFGIG